MPGRRTAGVARRFARPDGRCVLVDPRERRPETALDLCAAGASTEPIRGDSCAVLDFGGKEPSLRARFSQSSGAVLRSEPLLPQGKIKSRAIRAEGGSECDQPALHILEAAA